MNEWLTKNRASLEDLSLKNPNWFFEKNCLLFKNFNILFFMHFSKILVVDKVSAIGR